MEEDRACDIVGDIGNDRILRVPRNECEYILMMDRYWGCFYEGILFSEYDRSYIFSHESFIEDFYHIRIELDHIERLRVMREYIFGKCSISRSYFDDMPICYIERVCYSRECFFIYEEVLTEGFFSFYYFWHIFYNCLDRERES